MKNLNITKSEYIKILKSRGISIKRSASKHEVLKLINNLTKEDLSYLLKLRNIKINDDGVSSKSIVNELSKDTHKKAKKQKNKKKIGSSKTTTT